MSSMYYRLWVKLVRGVNLYHHETQNNEASSRNKHVEVLKSVLKY